MSGTFDLGHDVLWWTRSSVFYWLVDSLAEQAHDAELVAHLREVSDNNLGWVGVDDLGGATRDELLALLAAMPGVARATLPDPAEGRDAVIAQIEELAGLAARAQAPP